MSKLKLNHSPSWSEWAPYLTVPNPINIRWQNFTFFPSTSQETPPWRMTRKQLLNKGGMWPNSCAHPIIFTWWLSSWHQPTHTKSKYLATLEFISFKYLRRSQVRTVAVIEQINSCHWTFQKRKLLELNIGQTEWSLIGVNVWEHDPVVF